jgi:hypothetical protein
LTWTIDTTDDLAFLAQTGPPPQDVNAVLRDHSWSRIFYLWAEHKKSVGDQQPLCLYQLDSCLEQTLTLAEYYKVFFADGAEYPVEMPLGLKIKAKLVVEGSADGEETTVTEDTVKAQLNENVQQQLLGYLGEFIGDVKPIQEEEASKPKGGPGGITLDDIDTARVATVNEAAMKALAVGQSIGFLQFGEHVLIGQNNHNQLYFPLLQNQANSCQGTLTMLEKGGAFGPGAIRVDGSNDTDSFKAAIRDISKKKITFT